MRSRALVCCLVLLLAACSATPASSPPTPWVGGEGTATPAPVATAVARATAAGSVAPLMASAAAERELAVVVRAVDGDTIDVRRENGVVERVRYIGIDTPETVDPRTAVECFGAEASARNKALVEGREVGLERDVSERDRYDRLLRYVWVAGDDGAMRLVNEALTREGYAAAVSYPPDVRYQERFAAAERAARGAGLGLWGACGGPDTPAVAPSVVTPTSVKVATSAPTARGQQCHPSYPTLCLPGSPDLDCADIPQKNFPVKPPDPHRLDGDGDGVGCER